MGFLESVPQEFEKTPDQKAGVQVLPSPLLGLLGVSVLVLACFLI